MSSPTARAVDQPRPGFLVERLAQVLAASHHFAYAHIAPDFTLTWASDNFASLTLRPTEPPEGQRLSQLFVEFIGAEATLQSVLEGQLANYQLERVNRGTTAPFGYLTFQVFPLDPAQPEAGWLLLIKDVTEQAQTEQRILHERNELRQGEAALRRAQAELEEQVRARTFELAEANIQLLEIKETLEKEMTERHAAENSLAHSFTLLQAAFEATADGLVVVDDQQRIVAYNKRFLEIARFSPEHYASTDLEKLRDLWANQTSNPNAFRQRVTDIYAAPTEASEDLLVLSDGRRIVRYSFPHWLNGQVVGRVWSFRDSTDQERTWAALRESGQRYRIIAELVSDYTYSFRVTEDGALLREWITAESFERITGYTPAAIDARGSWWRALVHPADLNQILGRTTHLLEGQAQVGEYRIITATGDVRWLRETLRPVWDDARQRVTHIYGAAQDITARKQVEEEIRQLNVELEHRVVERTAQLQSEIGERHKAQDLLRRQNDYLAALHTITLSLFKHRELETLVKDILHHACDILVSLDGAVFLLTPDAATMTRRAARGLFEKESPAAFGTGEGLVGQVWETSEPQIVLQYTPQFKSNVATITAHQTVIGAPLTSREGVRGVLLIGSSLPGRHFLPLELDILKQFTHLAAIALDNLQLYLTATRELTERQRAEQTLRRQNEQLSLLHEITLELLHQHDLDALLQTLVERAATLLDAPFGLISLLNPADPDEMLLRAFTGNQNFTLGMPIRRDSARFTWSAVDARQPATLDDYSHWPHRLMRHETLGLRAIADFPIIAGEQCLGVLSLARNRPGYVFDRDAVQVGQLLAQLAALVLERAEWRALAQQELDTRRKMEDELRRSNSDLEQFAYSTSHDLQEPLRMISSYLQLLARKYRGQLDTDANDYIAFATEGATRMSALIKGLLDYSRLGRGVALEDTDSQVALTIALTNLKFAIADKQAVITAQPLPHVLGNSLMLTQLFQNLISNALKFCKDRPPQIQIAAEPLADFKQRAEVKLLAAVSGQVPTASWVFTVGDNGIGIAPQYFERIFQIFQRLHAREEYQGTGLGLTICKKIVEHHGGRMWLTSTPGEGTTFFFTLLPTTQQP